MVKLASQRSLWTTPYVYWQNTLISFKYGDFLNNIFCMHAIISRGLYIFTPFFTASFIVQQLVLQTIYVLKKEVHQFLVLKYAVFNQEWFQIKSERTVSNQKIKQSGIVSIFEKCDYIH